MQVMNDIHHSTNHGTITQHRKQMWSKGDFNEVARQNVAMAESLCLAADPHPGQKVLDVACGSGTAALVPARRYCEVTGIDFVPQLIERARKRADAAAMEADFIVADAQELPFPDDTFDVVLSVYGVQFAPDQEKAANEMLRVCKPGGKIALAGPAPEGWSGDFFATHGKYMPPAPGVDSPLRWGTESGLHDLLGAGAASIQSEKHIVLQYYLSLEHALEVFSTWFGPTVSALEQLNAHQQEQLLDDLKEVMNRYNRSTNGTAIVENTYLQSIVHTSVSR